MILFSTCPLVFFPLFKIVQIIYSQNFSLAKSSKIISRKEDKKKMQLALNKCNIPHFFYLFFIAASILNPYEKYRLFRNPKFKNQGEFLTLSQFLYLTKGSGILISIEVSYSISVLLVKESFLSELLIFMAYYYACCKLIQ